jgi:MtN3 and saliva related transmembrane protein
MAIDYVAFMGIVAGALTTFSLLPQLFKVFRRRSAKDLSRTWLVTSGVGFALWTGYGYYLTPPSLPLMVFSALSLVFALALLTLKLRYK